MKKFIFVIFFLPLVLLADQYQIVSSKIASNAKKILEKQESIISYCEPCGDQTCDILQLDYLDVKSEDNNKDENTILVNNNEIDLAYTFVKVNNIWQNLAIVLGLKPEGVSRKIDSKQCNYSNVSSISPSEESVSTAEANDWPYVCEQPNLKEFANKRYFVVSENQNFPLILADSRTITIDKKNKIIKVWTIWLASEEGRLDNIESLGKYDDYSDFGYQKGLIIINYKTMKLKTLSYVHYNCDGSTIFTNNSQLGWDDIVPGSVMEGTVETILKKYKLK